MANNITELIKQPMANTIYPVKYNPLSIMKLTAIISIILNKVIIINIAQSAVEKGIPCGV